ncbi:hypothetical protein BKA56DRAFT_618050 [Ilyonectria sp. MPI-CAGE-AT-0026]|nr:hypothetical protein BKA56DRAFT_618050 [Ilyonectria sp. MPI-CAGE-AT-0026]
MLGVAGLVLGGALGCPSMSHWGKLARKTLPPTFHFVATQRRPAGRQQGIRFHPSSHKQRRSVGAVFDGSLAGLCNSGRRAWHEETFPACTFALEWLLDELIPVACRKTGKGVDGTRQHHEHDTGPRPWFPALPKARGGSGGGSGSKSGKRLVIQVAGGMWHVIAGANPEGSKIEPTVTWSTGEYATGLGSRGLTPGDGMELETGRMEMLEPSQTLSAWPRVGRDESHGSTVRHGHRRARAWRSTSRDGRSQTAGSDRFPLPQLSPSVSVAWPRETSKGPIAEVNMA